MVIAYLNSMKSFKFVNTNFRGKRKKMYFNESVNSWVPCCSQYIHIWWQFFVKFFISRSDTIQEIHGNLYTTNNNKFNVIAYCLVRSHKSTYEQYKMNSTLYTWLVPMVCIYYQEYKFSPLGILDSSLNLCIL